MHMFVSQSTSKIFVLINWKLQNPKSEIIYIATDLVLILQIDNLKRPHLHVFTIKLFCLYGNRFVLSL